MSNDYFELLGLPHSFDIDRTKLDANYFALQKESHPDKAKDGGAQSAKINTAYNTLKNRLKRAEYMAGPDLKACPALLLEIMELRENGDVKNAEEEVEKLYAEFAAEKNHDKLKDIFVRIKYLTKFIEDVAANT